MYNLMKMAAKHVLLCGMLLSGVVILPQPAANAVSAPSFQLPLRGHVNVVGYVNFATSGIGDHARADSWAADITSDKNNMTVYPVAPGTVAWHGYNCATKKTTATSCYGNVVVIYHGGGYYSLYAHLGCDNVFNSVFVGEPVGTATPIGTMSNTGYLRSTCASPVTGNVHLHFAVRYSARKESSTSALLFGGNPVNIWEYPSAGGTAWIPGLPWPQATTAYNPWTVSLTPDNAQPTAGDAVTLTAQASSAAAASLPPFQIDVTDMTTGATVATCTSGGTCSAQVTQNSATTQTYAASIDYPEAFATPTVVDMADASTSVTWHAASWGIGPAAAVRTFSVGGYSSNDVWAVGGNSIEHWDSTGWSTSYTLPGAQFNAVHAVSPGDVWAVGYQDVGGGLLQTLTAHWDGTNWTVIPSPNVGTRDNQLLSVDGDLTNNVWAVGYYNDPTTGVRQPLAEYWNGSAWAPATMPSVGGSDSGLQSVSMDQPGDAWAVGFTNGSTSTFETPLVEHWSAGSWQVIPSQTVDTAHAWVLGGVAATAPGDVWAVGHVLNNAPAPPVPDLIEHCTGSACVIFSTADPAGAQASALNGISAISASNIWAVGEWTDTSSNTHTLIKHWDGVNWSVVASPDGGAYLNQLFGVAAITSGDIWAVGSYADSATSMTLPLYLRYN